MGWRRRSSSTADAGGTGTLSVGIPNRSALTSASVFLEATSPSVHVYLDYLDDDEPGGFTFHQATVRSEDPTLNGSGGTVWNGILFTGTSRVRINISVRNNTIQAVPFIVHLSGGDL